MKANKLKIGYILIAIGAIVGTLGCIGFGIYAIQNIAFYNSLGALLLSLLIAGGAACLLIGAIIALVLFRRNK